MATPTIVQIQLITHQIVTKEALPIHLHHYHCAAAWEDELDLLLDRSFIEPSTSSLEAPMFAVPKKNGSIHLVVDYRRLNVVTVPDPYTMPTVEVMLEKMGQAKIFSTLDLARDTTRSLWLPITERRPHLSEWGKFQFILSFGLRNAPAMFQYLMDLVLHDTFWFCLLLVTIYVSLVILRQATLTTWDGCFRNWSQLDSFYNYPKMSSSELLGHKVSAGKISSQDAKVDAVANFIRPTTKKVPSFLGLTGYYRRYIPEFSGTAAPLSDLMKAAALDKVV